ncbi:type II toxin-antitoxin system PemK/MazF family toxin [Gluconobacter kondonii]|uniref:type II toxin-antitoxin system PemK/MazF family toxin n=1 Tax=Gluconobacter kondonii TaxID=941463 RepID=UPI000C08123D|nr:type II toxin-antitoxin system PemK/MazF family toxin [Gluconobacter kondonii]
MICSSVKRLRFIRPCPSRSDSTFKWLHFRGTRQQAGHRPAVVLSSATYNRIGLFLCCPLTTKRKSYTFEVGVGNARQSAVLADQVESLDWRARSARALSSQSGSYPAAVKKFAHSVGVI